MENITKIVCSMNTHTREQIFHPCWWINSAGNHPEAYTIITYKDVANGKWKVLNKNNQKKSKQYLKQLEKSSKKNYVYGHIIALEVVMDMLLKMNLLK